MRYSLINVASEDKNGVNGYWMQDAFGSLESVKHRAKELEAVNSNMIQVAVTEPVSSPVPMLEYHTMLRRVA